MNYPHDYLPALLTEVAEQFGLKAAMELARDWGGKEIKLPKHPHGSIWAERIDIDVLKFLCDKYGASKITIPIGPWTSEAKRKRYLEELAVKHSNNDAADIAGVHWLTITRARKRAKRKAEREGDIKKHTLPLFKDMP